MVAHILVADDEARIREVVQYALEHQGYRVTLVTHGRAALERARQSDVDLVILDVMMPELDGLDVCRELRRSSTVPVLFLSSRGEEIDRVLGLELGGDDYLTKPFGTRELVARVKALLRRGVSPGAAPGTSPRAPEDAEVLEHDGIRIDVERHEVRCGEHVLRLTATEFGVLAALFERPGVVLSRGQLMQRAYPFDNLVTERTLDTHVRRIRAKFRPLDRDPIETVHGVGYKAAGA
ncbi:MAG: response regulator transcription factor [Sandaracinaceae bacterium]|nr:response regulator transcription factor [Sandaracinaceae bacterium]